MNILITAAQGETFQRHFPAPILEQLRTLGTVVCNPFPRPFTAQELAEALKDTDIVVTHWGTPQIDACMLDSAPRLRLLAHAAGTVAHIASEAFYGRNIPVLSANSVMARFVAESVLGYMIAATHRVAQLNASIRAGSWDKRLGEQTSLFGNSIGLIGLGTVGRELLSLLAPFGCAVRVYDPYLPAGALERWPFAAQCGFEEAMRQPIVSVHASQTPETYHMIDANALELLPEGGILWQRARLAGGYAGADRRPTNAAHLCRARCVRGRRRGQPAGSAASVPGKYAAAAAHRGGPRDLATHAGRGGRYRPLPARRTAHAGGFPAAIPVDDAGMNPKKFSPPHSMNAAAKILFFIP